MERYIYLFIYFYFFTKTERFSLKINLTFFFLLQDVSSCETIRSRSFHKDEMIRGHIDTAAPFESVKEAINKFGGVVHREAQIIPAAEVNLA